MWKVRLGAYEELITLFTNQADGCFQLYGRADLFRNIVTDSNVVAQETGVNCLCKLLEYGNVASRLSSIIPDLCEKCFVSSRNGTKENCTELLMLFIEASNSPDQIIEQITPFLSHKIPKVVASAVKSLTKIYSQFGCKTVSTQPVIPLIPKLFAHADRNVRLETTSLTIEFYKWLGPALETLIFSDLKPIQQKDLKAAFEKISDRPQQSRLLKSQKQEVVVEADSDGDVEMEEKVQEQVPQDIDPYDLAPAIDVLAKLPPNFYTDVSAVKWSERKEALESLHGLIKVIKIEDGNFGDLIRCLAKCITKDANIQVATVLANCVECIANGLRQHFEKYVPMVLSSLLDRSKEKKQSVADALNSALDAVFSSSSFSYISEDVTKYLAHKTPQVKIATAQFLTRCLQTTKIAPAKPEYESFLPNLVKLLSDSQEPVRSSASVLIGTLMKIVGERELNGYLNNVDEIRMTKVKECFNNATIMIQPVKQVTKKQPVKTSLHPPPQLSKSKPTSTRQSVLRKPLTNSIPSKRIATSPLKNDLKPPAMNRLGANALSRNSTLNLLNSPPLRHETIPSLEREELEKLRQEKIEWLKEKEQFQWKLSDVVTREERLMKEITSLQFKNESLIEEHTRDIINIKSKDTQLARLNSDLESTRVKLQKLMSLAPVVESTMSPMRTTSRYVSPFEDTSSAELSSKVKRLSIENLDKENSSPQLDFSKSKVEMDLDNTDDSWRRALEVTSQLKARIEKMKARSRSNVSNFTS